MQTKLSSWTKALAEACVLAALAVLPPLFDVHSNSTFELDKVAVLRSLMLIVALAWLAGWTDVRIAGRKSASARLGGRIHPLWMAFAVAFLAVQGWSTLTSVAPRQSFWGSSARFQGLYTSCAYFVVFVATLNLALRKERVDRLVDAALVSSIPVSLYGIIQHFGTDPVPWLADVSERVSSTLGNALFLGAFLVSVVPLTIYRHVETGRRVAEGERAEMKGLLVVGGLLSMTLQIAAWWIGPVSGTLAAAVTLALWAAQGRLLGKPFPTFVRIGAHSVLLSAQIACLLLTQSRGPLVGLAGALAFLMLLWSVAHSRWKWVYSTIAAGFTVILFLVLLNMPSSPIPWARELPYIYRLSRVLENTGQVRLRIWEAVEALIRARPERAALGHGPETLRLVVPPYVSPVLGQLEQRGALPDRAHNETLDALATTGVAGLALYLAVFTGVLVKGLRETGVLHSPRDQRLFLGLWLCGGLLGAVLARWFDASWRLAGAALPFGMVGGLFACLAGSKWRMGSRSEPVPWSSRQLLVAVSLAAILAHFIEIQLGIAVTVTRVYFWALVALVVTSGGGSTQHDPKSSPNRELVVSSLLSTLVLGTLVFDFVLRETNVQDISTISWLFGFTWLLGGIFAVTKHREHGLPGRCAIYAGVTFVPVALFAVIHTAWLRSLDDPGNAPLIYYALLLVVVLALSGVLLRHESLASHRWTRPGLAIGIGLSVLLLLLVSRTNLDSVRANIHFKQARLDALHRGRPGRAVHATRRALELEPTRDTYHSFLGQTLRQMAEQTAESEGRETIFEQAEKSFLVARRLSPLDPEHPARLARLHGSWAQHTRDPARRESRLRQALSYYEQALAHSPSNASWWNERGATYRLLGEPAAAREAYEHSLRLDDTFVATYLLLGELHREQGARNEAMRAYERALALAPNTFASHLGLAELHASSEDWSRALASAERALELAPPLARAAVNARIAEWRARHE